MSIAPEAKLAMGRIFGMMMREEQPGDIAEYERCRAIIMNASDTIIIDHSPNFARDYGKGAQGQWN